MSNISTAKASSKASDLRRLYILTKRFLRCSKSSIKTKRIQLRVLSVIQRPSPFSATTCCLNSHTSWNMVSLRISVNGKTSLWLFGHHFGRFLPLLIGICLWWILELNDLLLAILLLLLRFRLRTSKYVAVDNLYSHIASRVWFPLLSKSIRLWHFLVIHEYPRIP